MGLSQINAVVARGKIELAVERYAACGEQIADLSREHWTAVAPHAGVIPVDPDLNLYQQLDAAGIVRFVTVRRAGVLVGYTIVMVMPTHQHYRRVKWASTDGLWLVPTERRPRVALRMLEYTQNMLRKEGVILFVVMEHPDHPALGRLLAHLGFAKSGVCHSRRL